MIPKKTKAVRFVLSEELLVREMTLSNPYFMSQPWNSQFMTFYIQHPNFLPLSNFAVFWNININWRAPPLSSPSCFQLLYIFLVKLYKVTVNNINLLAVLKLIWQNNSHLLLRLTCYPANWITVKYWEIYFSAKSLRNRKSCHWCAWASQHSRSSN